MTGAQTAYPPHGPAFPKSFPAERQLIDAATSPWNRIGNLSIAGRQFCTATLITDRIIVTAAHCLWNKQRNNWYPPQFIHFLAGYQQGNYQAHSLVKKIHPNPNYAASSQTPASAAQLLEDWALVELEEPVGLLVGSIALHVLKREQQVQAKRTQLKVALVGYRHDTREAMSIDAQCQLLPTPTYLPASLLSNNCHALTGDSGGPLLSKSDTDQWQLIGIHAGRSQTKGGQVLSLAIPAAAFYDQLLSLLLQSSSSL